jgi:hypothetical protein
MRRTFIVLSWGENVSSSTVGINALLSSARSTPPRRALRALRAIWLDDRAWIALAGIAGLMATLVLTAIPVLNSAYQLMEAVGASAIR